MGGSYYPVLDHHLHGLLSFYRHHDLHHVLELTRCRRFHLLLPIDLDLPMLGLPSYHLRLRNHHTLHLDPIVLLHLHSHHILRHFPSLLVLPILGSSMGCHHILRVLAKMGLWG